jgi:hypothetical protein
VTDQVIVGQDAIPYSRSPCQSKPEEIKKLEAEEAKEEAEQT